MIQIQKIQLTGTVPQKACDLQEKKLNLDNNLILYYFYADFSQNNETLQPYFACDCCSACYDHTTKVCFTKQTRTCNDSKIGRRRCGAWDVALSGTFITLIHITTATWQYKESLRRHLFFPVMNCFQLVHKRSTDIINIGTQPTCSTQILKVKLHNPSHRKPVQGGNKNHVKIYEEHVQPHSSQFLIISSLLGTSSQQRPHHFFVHLFVLAAVVDVVTVPKGLEVALVVGHAVGFVVARMVLVELIAVVVAAVVVLVVLGVEAVVVLVVEVVDEAFPLGLL